MCNLLIAEKKCITKFEVVQRQLELWGSVVLGPELEQELWACFPGDTDQIRHPLGPFTLLLLYQVPAIGILSANLFTRFWVANVSFSYFFLGGGSRNNYNPVFRYSVSPKQVKRASKWENQPPKQKKHFPQLLMAGRVDPIFLLACPLGRIRYLGAPHTCLVHLK